MNQFTIDIMDVQKIQNLSDVIFEEEFCSKLQKPGFYQRNSFYMKKLILLTTFGSLLRRHF